MEFEEWEPLYMEILEEFGYSREEDERAARVLTSLVSGRRWCDPNCLRERIGGSATVCGNAPSLEVELDDRSPSGTILSADGATKALMDRGFFPDLIVTDLDGDLDPQVEANSRGAVAVIHAHGDNVERLREHVPRFRGRITPTTQSKPFDRVFNFGGFTDGDRAFHLARHFGAEVSLMGFDFEFPREGGEVGDLKRRKLQWAKRLIHGP
ncbi:MAG: 6-hydroxymethylpterin diphosphokinase MptE-like protein [Methanomassiliicoccales archaeon]